MEPQPPNIVIGNLAAADLPRLTWVGGSAYLATTACFLSRAGSGEVEFLALRSSPATEILAIGCVDFSFSPGAGKISQLAAKHKGVGYGTRLIRALEDRIRARGLMCATLDVEILNRAYGLYLRLGYAPTRTMFISWDRDLPDGQVALRTTPVHVMAKQLLIRELRWLIPPELFFLCGYDLRSQPVAGAMAYS